MAGDRTKRSRLQRWLSFATAVVPIFVGVLAILSPVAFFDRVRDLVFDEYQVFSPRAWSPDEPVRIIAIDDDALAAVGQWPWPRDKLAELLRDISELGPAAIGMDIVFSEEDRLATPAILRRLPPGPERDRVEKDFAERGALDTKAFAEAIAAAPVVLSETFTNNSGAVEPPEPKINFVILGDSPVDLPPRFGRALQPLPNLSRAAKGLGGINFIPDRDMVVRRAPMVFAVGPPGKRALQPSFAQELLRVAQIDPADHTHPSPSPIVKSTGAQNESGGGGRGAIMSIRVGAAEIATEADGQARLRFSGHQAGRFLPASRILARQVPRGEIEGRIALIGVTAASANDLRSTPIDGAVPGVEIHAETIEHVLSGERLARPDYAAAAEALAALVGGLLVALIARRLRPALSGAAILCLLALAGCVSWWLFSWRSTLIDPLFPSATWLATWSSVTVAAFRRAENERRFVRAAFSRYLAPAVVERLAANPALLRLGGEEREITVLFCDARDFTTRSENLGAEGVVRFLNSLLTPLTAAVLSRDGAIDKYLGDGLMAYWNAPVDIPNHASRACEAALAIAALIPDIDRAAREAAGAAGITHAPVVVGVGINTGRAFVGNMGSEQRFDYSMVGDPVNVAARLESATKEFGAPIIVSEETRRQASGFRFVPLGAAPLKGRHSEATVHALHGVDSDPEPGFDAFLAAHVALLAAKPESPEFADALARLREFPQAARYEIFYAALAVGGPVLGGSRVKFDTG